MRVQSGEKCLSCILNLKITKAIKEVVSGSIWVVRTVMSQLQTLISRGTRPCCLVEPSKDIAGGVYIEKADSVFVHECIVKKNIALNSIGGFVISDIDEQVLVDTCKFEENEVTDSVNGFAGGLLLATLDNGATIRDSEFKKNVGGNQGGGFVSKNLIATVVVEDSKQV